MRLTKDLKYSIWSINTYLNLALTSYWSPAPPWPTWTSGHLALISAIFPVFLGGGGGGPQAPGLGQGALPDVRPLRGNPPQPPLPRAATRPAPAPPHRRLKLIPIVAASASSLSAICTVLHDLRVDGRGRWQCGCEQLVEATARGGREAISHHFQRPSSRNALLNRR